MAERIRALDGLTIGKIAAGEVVERPAQVIKELVENSLDAEPTRIEVSIEQGGFMHMSVRDDGSGIEKDDLQLAIERHATSKLANAAALNEIHTLGFRGEALASIGAISEMKVSSRVVDSDGFCIEVDAGVAGAVEPSAMDLGTTVEVRRIFYNVPARLAFQRRAATESARIVEVVVEHAMSHPRVSFRLHNDGREVLNVAACTEMEDRLYDLLGASSERLIELRSPPDDLDAPGEERWSGWISPPEVSRGRGDDVHVLVNGRPVSRQPMHEAIRRGYHTRLMVGRHPVALLRLDLPASEVDVNVHPTKREVRFAHSWRVLQRLERCIQHTLSSVSTQPGSHETLLGMEGIVPVSTQRRASSAAAATSGTAATSTPQWARTAGRQLSLDSLPVQERLAQPDKNRPLSRAPGAQQVLPELEQLPVAPPLSSAERSLHRHSSRGERTSPQTEPRLESSQNDTLPRMVPLCQFADSYIVAQAGEELLLIDQHALHERIRFERLRYDDQTWAPQSRLEPLQLQLSRIEAERLQGARERIEEVGFGLEQDGDDWLLTAQPAVVPAERLEDFFADLVQDLGDEDRHLSTVETLRDHIAFMQSCRGAVKANEELSLPEMRRLLEDMANIANPWACVHGRPTALRVSIDELDRHFGRHG